jgi:hypothetical protein
MPPTQFNPNNLAIVESDVKLCVDRALGKIGPRLKYVVYLKMGEMTLLSKRESKGILDNPDLLRLALQAILGKAAVNIELRIMDEIRRLTGRPFQQCTDMVSLIRTAKEQEDVPSRPTLVNVITELFPY